MTKKTMLEIKTVLIVLLLWASLSATMVATNAYIVGWFTLGIAIGMIMSLEIFLVAKKKMKNDPEATAVSKQKKVRLVQLGLVILFMLTALSALTLATPSAIIGWLTLGIGVGMLIVLQVFVAVRSNKEPQPEAEEGQSPTEQQTDEATNDTQTLEVS